MGTGTSGAPEHLERFDPADWPAEGTGTFERYQTALRRWLDARDAWATEHGWDGDQGWHEQAHAAIVAMPDAPFDPADL